MAALCIVLVSACTRRKPDESNRKVVGFAINTLNNPFFVDMKLGAETAASEAGIEVLIQATEREMDVEKQVHILENLIQRNVHVLCVTPNGSKEIIPAILKANARNIPFIVVDSRVDQRALKDAGGWIASFVGSDNDEGGQLAGEFVAQRLGGKGDVAILEGPAGHETGDSRLRGFRQAIAKVPALKVVSSQLAGFDRSQGYSVFQNILVAHPAVRAVFACNDLMALGAVEAIAAAGKTGEIIVVGFDAIDEAREAIRQGSMHASIAQYPAEMGRVAVQTAVRLLKGEPISSEIPTKIRLITQENLGMTDGH